MPNADPRLDVELVKALATDKRPLILEWLRDPEAHFPAQRDGDLVRDGVCSLFIADKLGMSQPVRGDHRPGPRHEDQAVGVLPARRGPYRRGEGATER